MVLRWRQGQRRPLRGLVRRTCLVPPGPTDSGTQGWAGGCGGPPFRRPFHSLPGTLPTAKHRGSHEPAPARSLRHEALSPARMPHCWLFVGPRTPREHRVSPWGAGHVCAVHYSANIFTGSPMDASSAERPQRDPHAERLALPQLTALSCDPEHATGTRPCLSLTWGLGTNRPVSPEVLQKVSLIREKKGHKTNCLKPAFISCSETV